MDPQTPSLDLGHTRGVRQRILKSLPAVRATKNFDAAFQEALRRMGHRLGHRLEVEYDESHISFVRAAGLVIEKLGVELVAADHALVRARRLRREACDRREAVRQETYRALSKFRDDARGILRPRRSKGIRCLNGATERDPHYLLSQVREVVDWAGGMQSSPDGPGAGLDWSKFAAPLVTLHDDLETAIDAAVTAGIAVDAPLVSRKLAIKAFDQELLRGCRVLECTFEVLGLPTLAAEVRPYLKGTGRVGRPSIRRPQDEHPDLVAGLRASGLLPFVPSENAWPEQAPEAGEPTAGEESAGRRRRIVFGVAKGLLSAPTRRSGKARRPLATKESTGDDLRRRRLVRHVSGARPTDGLIRPRVVRRPRGRQQELAERASVSPWTAKALDWWHRRGNAPL